MNDLYNLIEVMIHAGKIGVPMLSAERRFKEGLEANAKKEIPKAEELFSQAFDILNWEINSKRRTYRPIIRNASTVMPIDINEKAVQVWPMLTSKNGDMEWNAAIKEIWIAPNEKWNPPQENLEKLVYVISGRGIAVIEGNAVQVFVGDAVCVPSNMLNRFETTDFNAPMGLLVWEAYPNLKHDELKGAKNHGKFPEIQIKEDATEEEVRSSFEKARSSIEKANSMGINQLYGAALCYDSARKCLQGDDLANAYTLFNIAIDQVNRYGSDLETNRAKIAAHGVSVSNRMYLNKQDHHDGTCNVWGLKTALPAEYSDALDAFEIEAGARLEPHVHNLEEFYYVLQGRGLMMVGDPIGSRQFEKDQPGIEVNPGDLISIPPNSLHSICPVGDQYRISCIAYGGFTSEAPTLEEIGWESAYRTE